MYQIKLTFVSFFIKTPSLNNDLPIHAKAAPSQEQRYSRLGYLTVEVLWGRYGKSKDLIMFVSCRSLQVHVGYYSVYFNGWYC